MMATSFEVSAREIGMRPHRKASHYSVWLMPTGEVRRQLAEAILDLSREYSTPPFEPHVTLAGGIVGPAQEVVSKMADLASRIQPFTVRLTEVAGLDDYFRCLFIRVATTRSLMSANKAAREVFNLAKQPAFMPHLSLLYGNLPSSVKERIVTSLAQRFQLEFKASSLHLYLIENEPAAWRRLARFRLGL
jgi:putative hydrolase of the HAD superfamily